MHNSMGLMLEIFIISSNHFILRSLILINLNFKNFQKINSISEKNLNMFLTFINFIRISQIKDLLMVKV